MTKASLALLAAFALTPTTAFAQGAQIELLRFTTSGVPDTTFGGDGEVLFQRHPTGTYGMDVVIDPAGKMVVAVADSGGGLGQLMVARFNADGTPDTSFSQDGFATAGSGLSRAVAVHRGKIILVGEDIGDHGDVFLKVARFNADGAPDYAFNGSGSVTFSVGDWDELQTSAVAIMPTSSRIIVAGTASNDVEHCFVVARIHVTGSLDRSFSDDGINVIQFPDSLYSRAYDMALQTNTNEDVGFVALAGEVHEDEQVAGVAVLSLDGQALSSFNGDGLRTVRVGVSDSYAYGIKVDAQGRIVLGGSTHSQLSVVRLLINGNLDKSFSGDGKQTVAFAGLTSITGRDVLVNASGQIFVVGAGSVSARGRKAAIGALDANGTPIQAYGSGGKATFDSPTYEWMEVQRAAFDSSGRIVVGGHVN